jgi:Ca-activated chloride channel family protein
MHVRGDACNGIARVVVEQRFHNPHSVPLSVTYLFPLPADGAVSGYTFVIGGRRIEGVVFGRDEARERFEAAILDGTSAALLEQERSSLFTQEIGNIPPGAEVTAELVIDQPLRWLSEGAWEWRFPTAAAPRYLGGATPDAPRVTVDVADGAVAAATTLSFEVRDPARGAARVESPSHALTVDPSALGHTVRLAGAGSAALDRDIVVRWQAARENASFTANLGRTKAGSPLEADAFALCTIVPPLASASPQAVSRDLIVLLDTSGSMAGEPLDQARRVTSALIDTLTDRDQLELIEFSSQPRRWKRGAVVATRENRSDALAWLSRLSASGGTEMRTGIREAMATLRGESQRQIVLITDGQIGFEAEVVKELMDRLPRGSRLHTVGVGSAVNRSLTRGAARAGSGVEVLVGLGEDPERAAQRLVARTAAPLVVDVTLEGSALREHAPRRIGDLYAGAPLLIAARVSPSGGDLVARGRTAAGSWEARLTLPEMARGSGSAAAVTLFGREKAEDLEMSAHGRVDGAVDALLERVGLDFSIATRVTSWVAIGDARTVDPRDPTRVERIPQALPHGMSAAGLGLRPAEGFAPMGAVAAAPAPGAGAGAGYGSFARQERSRAYAPMPPLGAPLPPPPRAARAAPAPYPAAPRPMAPPMEQTRSSGESASLLMDGRVVLWKDGSYVVELLATALLEWDPDEARTILVVSPNGDRVAATLDVGRTTRRATIQPGERIRVTLTFERVAVDSVASLELLTSDGRIVVTIR